MPFHHYPNRSPVCAHRNKSRMACAMTANFVSDHIGLTFENDDLQSMEQSPCLSVRHPSRCRKGAAQQGDPPFAGYKACPNLSETPRSASVAMLKAGAGPRRVSLSKSSLNIASERKQPSARPTGAPMRYGWCISCRFYRDLLLGFLRVRGLRQLYGQHALGKGRLDLIHFNAFGEL
jgi:hypothetical protein